MRFALGVTAAGAEAVAPPSELQADQPAASPVVRWTWPSGPRTNRSMLSVPREITEGADVATPPTLVHGPHDVVQVRRQIAESAPRTKTSIFPVELDTAAGAEVAPLGGAPIETQPGDQVLPLR